MSMGMTYHYIHTYIQTYISTGDFSYVWFLWGSLWLAPTILKSPKYCLMKQTVCITNKSSVEFTNSIHFELTLLIDNITNACGVTTSYSCKLGIELSTMVVNSVQLDWSILKISVDFKFSSLPVYLCKRQIKICQYYSIIRVVIPYQITKFKSTNILAMAIWDAQMPNLIFVALWYAINKSLIIELVDSIRRDGPDTPYT